MIERYKDTYDFLNSVGPGFCLAKWTQVTIHLGSGLTHSCHHVGAHKIPLDELEENVGALHNTKEKKARRKEMLTGVRPAECDYCWRIEDNTSEYSDRVVKSIREWSQIDKDKIVAMPWDEDIYPRYVEVSFSNVCNFKCTYCGPPFSSKWTEEIKTHGPYKLKSNHYNRIKQEETQYKLNENPYIKAFWEWFPEAVKHMVVFRITGGEPLLSKHTEQVINYLLENPQPNLRFAINTNACPPDDRWERFVSLIKQLEDKNAIKDFELFTSAESIGAQAEYSRFGMDWNLFEKNIRYFLKNTKQSKICVMSAFNILSLPSLTGYLRFLNDIKRSFGYDRIVADFAYVRHPYFLDVKIANKDVIEKFFKPAINYIKTHNRFVNYEAFKLSRIYKDCMSRLDNPLTDDVKENRFRFYQFITEYDRRRGTNFLKVFPEYRAFFKFCKDTYV